MSMRRNQKEKKKIIDVAIFFFFCLMLLRINVSGVVPIKVLNGILEV